MKKKLKRLLAVLISFAVMAVSLPWLPATEASAADAASVPLKSLKAGDTVNFGPESSPLTWIVLNPSTGLLLLQSTYGGAHVTYDGHGNSEFNPNSIYNIGYFLNSDKQSDYYDVNEQGWGPVLEISSIPLQSHDWEYLTGYKVNCKVGLLSYDEYQKYRNIPGVVLNGRDWWLLSMAQGFGGMWMVQSNGDTKAVNPDKTFNGMEPNVRPAIYLDPNIPVTGGAGGTISKLMPTAPGFNTAPAAKQGSAALTTAITANCNTTGDKLVVSTSSSTLAAPKYLDPPPTGSNVINPYTSGSDIIRTSSGQYVGVYELNPCGNVVAFSQIQLTADDIKPVGNNERVALKNLKAGTTTVHFVGYDWILLNPATGFLMKKTPYSQQVFRRNDPKMTLEQARFNPADKENIACYLNGTDYDTGIFTGTGFYEHLTQTYPNSVGYIQYHPWQIKFYNMQVLNPRSGEQFQDPKTENCKIGLLNKDECMANAYLIRPVSCASFWWLIDYAITEKWVKTGKDDSLVSIDGAFVADELGREGPQALDNSLSVFPAIYIGPDSPVYVAQNNLVLAANDLPFTITAVQGSTVGTATVSVSPVSPAIRYYVSHSKIEFPERNESLPAGAVTSGVNLSAVPGDYVGVYCVNDNNQIMSFNQIQMTAAMCSPAVPTFSPNGGGPYTSGQTVTLGNIASGNTAYYTTDGSDPMTSSTKIQYTAPFLFSHNGTVTARTYNSEGGWSKMVSAAFTFLYNSAVSPASATFDLNTAKAADIPVTVSLNDNTMTDIKNGTDTLEKGKDYTVSDSGGKVTILKSYLSGLIPTSYTLTFDFDKGNAAKMSLTVVNTAVSDSTVSTDVLYADKNPNGGVYVDAPFKVNLNGNTLVNIRYGGTTLEKGKDYTVSDSGSTVTIPKESLSKFQIGQQILTFDFNAGCNSPSVNVMLNVIDTDTAPSTQCYKLFIDANGNRYMMCNNMILEVPAKTGTQRGKYMEAGKPYVVVGTGILGSIVDGTSAAKTKITVDYNDSPTANIAADAAGNLYFTDRSSQAIREVPAADSTQWGVPMRTGNVYTLPNKARIFTADADGNLYTAFTEGYNGKICMTAVKDETRFGICMKAGNVYTLIGLDGNADNSINGIPVNTAYIYKCSDMHVDASGNFYYADDESKIVEELANQDGIQRGTAMKAGYLYTVVGSGSDDKSDKPRIATKSEFYPSGVTTDAAGNLYFGSTYGSVCMVAASDGIQRGVYMKQGYAYRISPMSGNRLAVDSSKTIYDSYCISLNWESRMTTFPDDVPMSATAFPVELYGQKLTVYDIHSTNLYASVEHSTAGLTASDITVNDGAKLTFYGTDSTFKTPAAGGVSLTDGTDGKAVTTKVYFSVTSPDKTRTVQYTLNVTRNTSGNANLATVLGHKIAVTGTADDFYGSITVHLAAIHVPYSTAAVSINDLVPEDSSAYYLHLINDNWQNLSKVSLTAGSGTVIYVKVMAQNRDTNLYYKVTVYRDGPISVGSQNGALTAGTAGSATFAAAASDGTTVSDGSATVNWCDASGTATTAPAGLTPSAANFASNKSTVTITADKNAKAGTYYFKITSGDKTSGVTEVKVTAPVTLESIAITKPATKTVYTVGDKLDLSGLEVTGTYSDKSTKVETVTAGNVSGFDSTKAVASQTLTVKVGEKTATYTVEIKAAPVTLESIAITKPATKTVYTVGDKLDLTGLEVTGTYSDNSTKVETVTAGNVSGFDSSAPAASQTLTVKVGEKTASYTVEIKAAPVTLESIAITKPATKTVYTVGDKLDLTGLEVTGTYSDKSTKVETVTKDNVSGFDSIKAVASQTLTVTVGGKKTTYTVKISAAPVTLQSIAITKYPKQVYKVGDKLDLTGLEVTGTYSDNSTKVETVTADNVSGFDSTKAVASQTLTVKVGEKTASYTVEIKAAPVTLESIAITKPATKTVYTVGDKLDLTGLEVTGTYSDKSTKVETVTKDNVSGFDSTKAVASQTLTVTVGGKTATYTVEIKAAPVTLQSIAITKPASKTIYAVGDTLDLTGLEVTGTYSDKSMEVESVTSANVSGFDSSKPVASQKLTVTVAGKTASYTVQIKAAEESGSGVISEFSDLTDSVKTQRVTLGTAINLPQTLKAVVDGISNVFVSVAKWVSSITYNPNMAGTYDFTPVLDSGYQVKDSGVHLPHIQVTVQGSSSGNSSSGGSSSHHSGGTNNSGSPSEPTLPSSVTDTLTQTVANLSGATFPADVTNAALSVTQVAANGAPITQGAAVGTSDVQAAAVYNLAVSGKGLNIIGVPTLYNIKLLDQSGNAIAFTGSVQVKIPIPAGLRGTPHVYRYEADGTFTDMNAKVVDGSLIFTTTHFSYYTVVGTGNSITLDTSSYQMPIGGHYQVGVKLSGTKAASVKVYSTSGKTAAVTKLANGNYQITGKGIGTAYIMFDVYDSKKMLLTHASVRIDGKTGIRSSGNATRQIGLF